MKKISILGLLLLAFTVFAQTYTIKLNLKKGETYSVLSDMKMDMVQKAMGQEMPIKMNIITGNSYKVLTADKDGFTLEGKYNYIGNNVDVMGQSMKMASDVKDENPANKMFAAMVNIPYTMKVKNNGEVISVEGYEKIVEAMKNALPENIREQTASQFGKTFSKEQVAQGLKSTFFAVPPKPVKLGDTWDAVYVTQNNGVDLTNKMSCTLEAADKQSYKISYTGSFVAKEGSSIEQNGMKLDVKKMDGTMTGVLLLDKNTSWVKNNENKTKMKMEMEMKMGEQSMPMESAVDMVVVATDASAPTPVATAK